MGDVEKAGLLKMDFLGLRNLTTPRRRPSGSSTSAIRTRRSTSTSLPLDDAKTFELLQRGETKGVFQLESAGIRDLLDQDEARPLRRHHRHQRPLPPRPARTAAWSMSTSTSSTAASRRPTCTPCMKEVLEETYGVMVYQEQVMRILNRLGGIELSQAYATHQGDLARRRPT